MDTTCAHHADAAHVLSSHALCQVRMQSEGKLPAGVPRRYPSAMGAYSIIVKCALSTCASFPSSSGFFYWSKLSKTPFKPLLLPFPVPAIPWATYGQRPGRHPGTQVCHHADWISRYCMLPANFRAWVCATVAQTCENGV